jgi:hypothetical protein
MKKPFSWMVLLLFVAATLQQCTEDGQSALPEKVQFTCNLGDGSGSGRSTIDRVPDALIITIENAATGQTLLEHYRIDLLHAGDAFISKPLSLTPGQYNITFFTLVAGENELLYLTPMQGATLAPAVIHPLPYTITVAQGVVNNIEMEVMRYTEENFTEEFGYTSFNIHDVNPFKISAFIAEPGGLTYTTATAYIIEGEDTIKTQPLGPHINTFSFRGDQDIIRTLVVAKPGYLPYVREFKFQDFNTELEGFPIEVIFIPSTFTIKPFFDDASQGLLFQMTLAGSSGNLSVDWGDGNSDEYTLNAGDVTLEHQYTDNGDYQMIIDGDIDKITYLYAFYGQGPMKSINFAGLTALTEIRMGWTPGPEILDFSYNPALEFVMIPRIPQLTKVIVAEENVIGYMDVSGPNLLAPGEISYLSDRVNGNLIYNP